MCEHFSLAPKPLTFDFELPPSAGSSSPSDPFFPPRTRVRSVRSRALERVKSRSQNDVLAIPATDVSNFLDMLGRASARVDENSRKRMKARESELNTKRSRGRAQRISVKGKGRMHTADELGDHGNSVANTEGPDGGYSSLPVMQPKDPSSQNAATTTHADAEDVHMDVDVDTFAHAGDDDAKLLPSTHPKKGIKNVPPRSPTTTRRSQKRAAPPSPTPVRSSALPTALQPMSTPSQRITAVPPKPTPIPPPLALSSAAQHHTTLCSLNPIPAPTNQSQQLPHLHPQPALSLLPPVVVGVPSSKGRSSSAAPTTTTTDSESSRLLRLRTSSSSSSSVHFSSSQPRRALGMTGRTASSSSSSSSFSNSAAKKPFRPPLAAARSSTSPKPAVYASRGSSSPRVVTRRATSRLSEPVQRPEDEKSFGTDPDSSFDLAFDFDPEALEAVMKKYD
jgi:hypothetical protein